MTRVALIGVGFSSVTALNNDYVYTGWLDVVEYPANIAAKRMLVDGYCDVVVLAVRQMPNMPKFMDDLFRHSIKPRHVVLVVDDHRDAEVKSSHTKISVVTGDQLAKEPDLVMDYKRS